MPICPSCGFQNPEDAIRCALCGRTLMPAERAEASADQAAQLGPTPPAPPPPAAVPPPPTHAEAQPPASIPPSPAPVTAPMQPPTRPPYEAAPPPPYGAPLPYPMPSAVPPPPPLMMPRPQFTRAQWRNRYLLGLALGLIPVLIVLIFIGVVSSTLSVVGNAIWWSIIAALVLYLAAFIGMIVCLANDRLRPVGYGLLTMVVAGPVITVVSCFTIPALVRR